MYASSSPDQIGLDGDPTFVRMILAADEGNARRTPATTR